MQALGPSDVRRAARRLLRPENLALVTVGDLARSQQKALERAVQDFG
jgi:hypothetical protein